MKKGTARWTLIPVVAPCVHVASLSATPTLRYVLLVHSTDRLSFSLCLPVSQTFLYLVSLFSVSPYLLYLPCLCQPLYPCPLTCLCYFPVSLSLSTSLSLHISLPRCLSISFYFFASPSLYLSSIYFYTYLSTIFTSPSLHLSLSISVCSCISSSLCLYISLLLSMYRSPCRYRLCSFSISFSPVSRGFAGS